MAVIDLNNLVRPKQKYNPNTQINVVAPSTKFVYSDLHLDIKTNENIGLGFNTVNSDDIKLDYDLEAIKNSLRNIFTTKKGQKILNPEFGSSLEQYLFSSITESNAKAMGNDILNDVGTHEPRIKILEISVELNPDENSYHISIYYELLEINKQYTVNMIAKLGGQVFI